MIETEITKDAQALTMTVVTTLDASVDRTWQLWADPRQLERWWGPPGYPATVVDHDLRPGGRVSYFMTSPEGDKHHGWWEVLGVDAPRRLELRDGFGDDTGAPNLDMPTSVMVVSITEGEQGRSVMTVDSSFPSLEAMQMQLDMGMEEGIRGAIGQIEAILADTV